MSEAFMKEAQAALQRMCDQTYPLAELEWFVTLMLKRFDPKVLKTLRPRVIVLGMDVPAEVLYASGAEPMYILGGSLETAHWADEHTPRDTDPVSRSSLGWLLNDEFDLGRDALIVTTASGDNRRKLAALLRQSGRKVFVLDVPANHDDPSAITKYADQLERLSDALAISAGKELSVRRLQKAATRVNAANRQVGMLQRRAVGMERVLSAPLRLMIASSRFFAEQLEAWTWHMARLNAELEEISAKYLLAQDDHPRVAVIGSPIVFPNFKLPLLMEDADMHAACCIDPMNAPASPLRPMQGEDRRAMLERIAQRALKTDLSGAYTQNTALLAAVNRALEDTRVEGIVWHVLKGQIEYDFELPEAERLAEEAGVPLIRLETDYQYQDVEQLRIRMEAFCEMLRQRRYGREQISS